MSVALELVHDKHSHRLNARQVAELFGQPLTLVAQAIDVSPASLRAHPDAVKAQKGLGALVHAWNELLRIFPSDDAVRNWLHHPNKRLQGRTPLELLRTKGLRSFTTLVGEIANGGYA